MIHEAHELGLGLTAPLRRCYDRCYSALIDLGCDVYVKTIYVGFSIGGEMVAAVYPRSGFLEIALALPDDIEGGEFKDATHLTWPTMPVCIEVRNQRHLAVALRHLTVAAQRVEMGHHNVRRPNEHFMGRDRRGNRPSL